MAGSVLSSKAGNLINDSHKRRELGAIYTPEHVVDYMLAQFDLSKSAQVLEPSGGDGVFVRGLLQEGVKPEKITVWDIDREVGKSIKELGVNFVCKDSLLNTDFTASLRQRFDYIVGNPPYLNKQSSYIRANKKQLRKKYEAIGANDTYSMFLYMAGNLLTEGGKLSFIISDTYRTLAIHKKLRAWILENFTIESITLCPPNLFREMGVSVATSIITIVNRRASSDYAVKINDCRENAVGDYAGEVFEVPQAEFARDPDYIFNHFAKVRGVLDKVAKLPKLIDYLDGGLGMHTTNNAKFIYSIVYGEKATGKSRVMRYLKNKVALEDLDSSDWRVYHKRGGHLTYFERPAYAIRWDAKSRANYKGYHERMEDLAERPGFVISGIATYLSARMMERGALWESNKAMCFFPKQPKKYPPEFFVGILNTSYYRELAKAFNHTSSLQVRDIRKLPMLDFSPVEIKEIANLVREIVKAKKSGHHEPDSRLIGKIEAMVRKAAR